MKLLTRFAFGDAGGARQAASLAASRAAIVRLDDYSTEVSANPGYNSVSAKVIREKRIAPQRSRHLQAFRRNETNRPDQRKALRVVLLEALNMLTRRVLFGAGAAAAVVAAWSLRRGRPATPAGPFAVTFSEAQWRQRLTGAEFEVLRESGTELPFSSPLLNEHRAGAFACSGCDRDLFASATKFDSGTGWPSFWAPIDAKAVGEVSDWTLGIVRTAVHCGRCGGHLGHVFSDGPQPTGLRYCMNGVALRFNPGTA